jgi:hypothetical protein
MSETTKGPKKAGDDEVDLLELIRRIGMTLRNWGLGLLKGILISVIFLLKRWIPLTISVIAGAILSYVLRSTSESFYTSDMMLRNNLVVVDKKNMSDSYSTTAEMISRINKLHFFSAEQNFLSLASSIGMKMESVKNIIDISAYWIIDEGRDGIPDYVDYKGMHNTHDTVNIRMPNLFNITLKIKSTVNLDQVRDGIIRFIETDTLYQQRNRLRLRQNDELLTRLNIDIQQLDSLQKVKYFEETRSLLPKNGGGQIVFMQEQKTQLVYSDIYFLYNKKQLLETERDLYKDIVTILSDFSLPTHRENGIFYYAKSIIPLFFIVTVIILILLTNKKKVKEAFNKY